MKAWSLLFAFLLFTGAFAHAQVIVSLSTSAAGPITTGTLDFYTNAGFEVLGENATVTDSNDAQVDGFAFTGPDAAIFNLIEIYQNGISVPFNSLSGLPYLDSLSFYISATNPSVLTKTATFSFLYHANGETVEYDVPLLSEYAAPPTPPGGGPSFPSPPPPPGGSGGAPTAAPEPSAYALLLASLFGLAVYRRVNRRTV